MSVVKISSVDTKDYMERVTATELDGHADSTVVGRYSCILKDTGCKVTVSDFTSELDKPLSVPVVNVTIAYDCKVTGETHILVIYKALYFRKMEVNLIPLFMMLLNSIEVDKCPKFLSRNPSEQIHSMYFPEDKIRIPFQLEGIMSYLPTRIPTPEELQQYSGSYLMLNPNVPMWDPMVISV